MELRWTAAVLLVLCLLCPYDLFESESTILVAASSDERPKAVIPILFVFIGMAICALFMHVMSRHHIAIPYTVMVFLCGIALAGVAKAHHMNSFGHSITEWTRINAELILYIFLPPLIFGEAMNLNWHYAKGELHNYSSR